MVTTNQLVGENNFLAQNNYVKSTGTLYLSDPTLGLVVNSQSIFAGTLAIQSPGIAQITTSSSSPAVFIAQSGTGASLKISDSGGLDPAPFIVDQNGNVSIGTTNTLYYKLNLVGNQGFNVIANNNSISANGSTPALTISQVGSGACLVISDDYSDISPFVIDNVGNVTIGATTSPGYKLYTTGGDVSFANNLFVTGNITNKTANVTANAVVANSVIVGSGGINNTIYIGSGGVNVASAMTIQGTFTIAGSTVYSSNSFIMNFGVGIANQNAVIGVYRTANTGNAIIRWNESNKLWEMNDVINGQYYRILTDEFKSDLGNLSSTSNIATSLALANANTFLQANDFAIYTYSVGVFNTANSAYATTNSAYFTANSGYFTANQAYLQANNAYNYANGQLTYIQASYNTANQAYLQANGAYTYANGQLTYIQASYNTANQAYIQANVSISSYNTANQAYNQANNAYNYANGQLTYIQSAYNQANNAYNYANSQLTYIQASYNTANGAYNQANVSISAYNTANQAYLQANGAYNYANGQLTYIQSSFNTANGAYNQANNAYNKANSGINLVANTGTGVITIGGTLTVNGSSPGIITSATANGFIITNNGVITLTSASNNRLYLTSTYGAIQIDLSPITGLSAGSYTYPSLQVDSYGRITTISNQTPVTSFNGQTGAVTLSSANVTTALGYTPANATDLSSNSIYIQAAYNTANGAYNQANNAYTYANGQLTYIQASYNTANAAFNQANTDVTNINITSGTFGNNITIPVISVAANGRITSISNTALTTTNPVRYLEIIAIQSTTTLTNQTNIIGTVEIPLAATITNIRARTTTGTANVVFNIGGTSIGYVNANTSGVSNTVSSSVSAYSALTLDVNNASGTGLLVTLTMQ